MSPDPTPSIALQRSQSSARRAHQLGEERSRWNARGLRSLPGPLRKAGAPPEIFPHGTCGGTKGKGSVASLVARGLKGAGYSVGLYTSPHVERITERVRCDGADIQEELLAAGIDAALGARSEAEADGTAAADASWFDLFTVAAFHALRAAGVDWAVIEVGLGGRLDSTNVIEAEVAILTNIDLEHTSVLGSTRAAIAGEKAGILRAGQTLVCGLEDLGVDEDPGHVIASRARDLGVPVVRVAALKTIGAQNLALASAALTALGKRGFLGPGKEPLSGVLLTPQAVIDAALPGRGERRWGQGGIPVIFGRRPCGEQPRANTGRTHGLGKPTWEAPGGAQPCKRQGPPSDPQGPSRACR